jgi:chloramphenicol O-acetyltransferase
MDLSSKSIESFKQDLIKQINKYRNNHGSKKTYERS